MDETMTSRQKEEQGESDTEEDADSDLEPSSESEERDDEEDGNDNKSSRSYNVGNGPEHGVELSEDGWTDDDDALSDSDEESGARVNNQPFPEPEASVVISTFDNHLSHSLASTEVDNLLKRKWRYTWEMPSLNISNWNWRGTGACLTEDLDINFYYGLKPRLYKHWLKCYKASGGNDFYQSRQRSFFSICNSYYELVEDFHWAVRPLVVAFGIFIALSLDEMKVE